MLSMPFQPPNRCPIKCDADQSQCLLYEGHETAHYFANNVKVPTRN